MVKEKNSLPHSQRTVVALALVTTKPFFVPAVEGVGGIAPGIFVAAAFVGVKGP